MSDARFVRRHRPFSTRKRIRALLVAPLLAAAVGGGVVAAQPAGAASSWSELRKCESGGNYGANTGNGYYGAYQFAPSTWRSLGYSGLPSDASPSVQDEAARKLAKRDGFKPWPVCGQGMGSSSSVSSVRASDSTGQPNFTTAMVHKERDDVRAWQAQMNKKGHDIEVDGRYGPESAGAARSLQEANGDTVDGVVGPETWSAAFDA